MCEEVRKASDGTLASGLGRIRRVTPTCTWRAGVTDSSSEETEELTAYNMCN